MPAHTTQRPVSQATRGVRPCESGGPVTVTNALKTSEVEWNVQELQELWLLMSALSDDPERLLLGEQSLAPVICS